MSFRLTKIRKAVLDVVLSSGVPLNAEQIHIEMRKEGAFSTVYRALISLENEGHICGFTLSCDPCGNSRYYQIIRDTKKHTHYFHCEKCHGFYPVNECMFAEFKEKIEKKYGFVVSTHTLYFTGLCSKCR